MLRRVCRLTGALSALGLLFFAVAATSALAAGPQVVKLTANDFSFTPDKVNLTVGQPVQLTISNAGKVDHDLKSDIPISNLTYQKADNDADEQKENSEKGVLDVDFNKADTAQVTFTPTKAGTYEFECDVPGHAEAGMKGTFVVGDAVVAAQPVAQSGAQVQASQPQAAQAPASLPKAGGFLGIDLLPLIAGASVLVVAAGAGARFALRRR